MELFEILKNDCMGLAPIITMIKYVFKIVQFGVPIILILYGTIDLGKAVIASDEKEVKAAQSRLIKRVIYGVLVFFIVLLISLVMNIVSKGVKKDKTSGNTDTESWLTCWEEA